MRNFILLFPLLLVFSASHGQKKNDKRSIGMSASLQWLNSYHYSNEALNGAKTKPGLFGIGASVFYSSGKNKFSLNGGLTTLYAFTYVKGGSSSQDVKFLEAIAHHNFYKGFGGILGVNFSNYSYTSPGGDVGHGIAPPFTTNNRTVGITFGTDYAFSKNFALALFYRPGIYSFDAKGYKHTLSLDARFDIKFWGR